MQKAVQGQIFLDCFNPILENAIGPRVKEGKREPCELKVSDFDDVMYLLEVPVKQLNILKLSISMSGYKEAYSNGGAEMLATKYPGMAGPPSRAGYDLTLTVDLDQLPMPPDRLLKCLSEVKRNLLGAPFDQAFDALRAGNGASLSLTALPWRKTETIYIIPQARHMKHTSCAGCHSMCALLLLRWKEGVKKKLSRCRQSTKLTPTLRALLFFSQGGGEGACCKTDCADGAFIPRESPPPPPALPPWKSQEVSDV
ncbi:unnamed protein product [Discosporangium mesarthrocarpum]